MSTVVHLIAVIIYMLIGAGDIYFAIYNFQRKRYFVFGAWIMGAISAATYLVNTIIQATS